MSGHSVSESTLQSNVHSARAFGSPIRIRQRQALPKGLDRSQVSFWRVVERPTQARGFQPDRSLLGGQLVADYGGGLCQFSGLLL